MRHTCALFQRGARTHVEVVYPDVSSGTVMKETFDHNLAARKETEKRKNAWDRGQDEGKAEQGAEANWE